MQKFNFEIQYIKGKKNVLANLLLRRSSLNVVSLVKETMFENIKRFKSDDVFIFIIFGRMSKI